MINSVQSNPQDLVASFQNLQLRPLFTQKITDSMLMAIHHLSAQLNSLQAQANALDAVPIHQLMSQLRQQLSSMQTEECASLLEALDTFIGPQKEILETAAKTSSSTSSLFSQSKNLLESLETALACCRKSQAYTSEYLIRTLFSSVVCLNPAASKEEIRRAIELELEHLTIVSLFKNVPGSDQEKYDRHLENYFKLLSKFFGFKIVGTDLKEQFPEIIEKLSGCRELPLQKGEKVVLRRQLAFLLSRPEWFFYQEKAFAKCLLLEAQEIAGKGKESDQAELQLILLEAEQATTYQGASPAVLKSLLQRILSLLPTLSPSDHVVALSTGVRIYEFLSKHAKPEKIMSSILATLQSIRQKGDKCRDQLSFTALQALAKCRFTFGFYASLCFKEEGQLTSGQEALLITTQDFWAGEKIRKAAAFLHDCLSSCKELPKTTRLMEGTFSLLEKFKLMLTQDIYHLANIYLAPGSNKMEFTIHKDLLPEIPETMIWTDESIVWNCCKKQFATAFFSDDSKKAEEIIKFYFSFHYLKAQQTLHDNDYISERGIVNVPMFMRYPSGELAVEFPQDVAHEKAINFFAKAKDYPLIEHIWVHKTISLIENLNVKIHLSSERNIETIALPGIRLFYHIYTNFRDKLEDLQGELAYAEITQDTMRAYMNEISASSFIKDVFSVDLKHLSSQERKEIIRFRRIVSLMTPVCDLCIDAYKFLDCYLPDSNSEVFYYLFQRAKNSGVMKMMMSESNQERIDCQKIIVSLTELRYSHLKGRAPLDQVQNAYIDFLGARTVYIANVEDPDEKLKGLKEIFANLPDTEEEIEKLLLHPTCNRPPFVHQVLSNLQGFKCMYLIVTQQVEAGIALFNKLISSSEQRPKKNLKLNKYPDFRMKIEAGYSCELMPHPENLIRDFTPSSTTTRISKTRPNRSGTYLQSPPVNTQALPPPPQSIEADSSEIEVSSHPPYQSEKKEILANIDHVLQNRELKKQKKQAKTASKAPTVTTTTTTPLTTTITTMTTTSVVSAHANTSSVGGPVSSPPMKKSISKKAMAIFMRLWKEKNLSENKTWEMRSFRSDVKMTRKEALKLIEALGGKYYPERGHGSHHVAHLPKIEFNGQDMGGLIDFESGELMITLTSDQELKFYQIKQLRDILLKQGFTPDTVVVKEAGD